MRTTARHAHHQSRWWPRTRPGTWAIGLAGVSLAGLVGMATAFALGVEPGDTFSDSWGVTIAGAAVLVSGGGGLAAAVDALFRRHDRGRLVQAALVVGALVTLAVLQQVGEGLGWLSA